MNVNNIYYHNSSSVDFRLSGGESCCGKTSPFSDFESETTELILFLSVPSALLVILVNARLSFSNILHREM